LVAVVRSYEDRLSKVEERLDKVEERLAELAEIVRSHEERLARLEEAVSQLTRAVGELAKAVAALDRRVLALGARRGVESEEAFRRAMRGVVKEILGVAKVERWSYFDAPFRLPPPRGARGPGTPAASREGPAAGSQRARRAEGPRPA